MLSYKLNLFKKEWTDVVFANRNKKFGAYWLRINSAAITAKALLFSSFFYILVFLVPDISSLFRTEVSEKVIKIIDVTILPPSPVNPKLAPPPPIIDQRSSQSRPIVNPPRSYTNRIKFPPPIVKPDEEVNDKPPQLEDFKNSDPGQFTVLDDPKANIVSVEHAGTGIKQAETVGDLNVYEFNSLEIIPSFPGGIKKFYE